MFSTYSTETLETYVRRHAASHGKFNLAVDKRRQKHREILQNLLKRTSPEELTEMLREASGINHLVSHPEKLRPLFPYMNHGELYKVAGLKKTFSTGIGEITIIAYDALSNSKWLHKVVTDLDNKFLDFEDRYLDGDASVTLYDLAKIVYAKHYFGMKLETLLAKEPDSSCLPEFASHRMFTSKLSETPSSELPLHVAKIG